MPKNNPKPNDTADYEERVKNTVSNLQAAEYAMEFAEGKELETIKRKNARRENSLRGSHEENKS